LILGDSRITFIGVALTLNERCGESATFVGESETGGLLIGEGAGVGAPAGDKVIIGSFRGEFSPGMREMRLLSRRVERLPICASSILSLASLGAGDAGTSNSINGCRSATIRVDSFFGSIGQRELCRFLGTHFKRSSENVEGLALFKFVWVVASCSAADTMTSVALLDRVAEFAVSMVIPRASTRSCFPSRHSSTLESHLASPQVCM
jgi:hypothetical protein